LAMDRDHDESADVYLECQLRNVQACASEIIVGSPDAVEAIQSLSATEDPLRIIVDSTPALIHTARPDGYLDYFNKPWLEYVGVTLDEVIGWKWTAFVHPDDVEGIVARWRTCLATGEIFEYETRVRRADGEYRWMLHRNVPLRDEHENIVKWYGSSIDIEDRKRAEDRLCAAMSERARLSAVRAEIGMALARGGSLREILGACAEAMVRHLDAAFARVWTLNGDGRELELQASAGMYTRLDGRYSRIPFGQLKIGLIAQNRQAHLTNDVQNDTRITDRDWAKTEKMTSFAGYPLVVEDRIVGVMGMFSQKPLTEGTLDTLSFVADGIAQGIERKRAEERLRRSEAYLAEGQRLGHTGSWVLDPSGSFTYWSRELFRIYGLDPACGAPSFQGYLDCIHPQDREFMADLIREIVAKGLGCDIKKRIVRPDGDVRYIRCVGIPLVENGILKTIIGTAMDVTWHEEMTQELQRRHAYLTEAQRLSHTGSFGWRPSTGEIFWSEETFRIFEYDPATKPTIELVLDRVHREDRAEVQEQIERATRDAKDFDREYRLLMPNGGVKHVHVVGHALKDESGIIEFVGAVMDVTIAKQGEENIRQQERELRQIVDLAPGYVHVLGADGSLLFSSREPDELHDPGLAEWRNNPLNEWRADKFPLKLIHPDDREGMMSELKRGFSTGLPHETEARFLTHDSSYRWFLVRLNPLRNEQGHAVRWYLARTDIDDRKKAEERLERENIVLREEVDKASMFEEIVGASPALRAVLSGVAKVAPTESTVLITGETGTGKELIARAIHKQSPRSSRAFVSVNCAAIPQNLIASELFGHEKGAFTGALQRRAGRFELAERGTIFLDEVGDLPPETQVALLRVLQEREFERVGGNRAIRADVRVITATNRDLQAAIGSGTFRDDLFYRLNVFPIHIPPLRERKEDIPILVEYFIGRYAAKAGKKIRNVKKKTLDLLQSYPWPGNIRELQNVIERSVIVSEAETLSVDESWLSRASGFAQEKGSSSRASAPLPLSKLSMVEEKEIIENALAEARGRVSGPLGAAAKLGVPGSTLESKIRALKIDKNRFRTA
jgi:PAS domain S-box-containing protein